MIIQAACRVDIPNVEDYQILPLHRHGDAGKIFAAFGFKPGECRIIEQGFIDEHGNFYNRKSASKYMKDHWQKTRLGDYPMEELFSEDLY